MQRRFRVATLLAGAVLATACGTPGKACFDLAADVNAHFYDGQAHATVVYLYPLSNAIEFDQTTPQQLLNGYIPGGMEVREPTKVRILPGEARELEYEFPEKTTQVGVVADLYREQRDREGTRRLSIPATCGAFSTRPSVYVGPTDLQRN